MNKRMSLIAVLVLSVVGTVQAESDDLGITLELEYRSKWLSKGAEPYGQQDVFFPTIDLDFYGTGFGTRVTHRSALGSGYVDKQRFDYRPYYKSVLFEDQSYATNYNISAGYEHYYGLSPHKSNTTWEWIFAFSWPNIIPEGIVPSYIAHYEYPAASNGADLPSGWVHRFILGYDLEIPQIPSPLHLSSEVAYTDGLGGTDHDWSYATFGVSTRYELSENMTFVPGVYQQVTMDDSVNKRKDITYCILGLKYEF
ncbi:MAG: hypothetical protein ACYSU3_10650 [Planctomycetota bacterium]